jgi:hypothetical protein
MPREGQGKNRTGSAKSKTPQKPYVGCQGWDFLADQIEGADAASLRIQAIATDT